MAGGNVRRKLLVIGIGAGNPDHVTIQAVEALNRADVFFIPDKGEAKGGLAEARREILRRFVREPRYRTVPYAMPVRRPRAEGYDATVAGWHAEIAGIFARLLIDELVEGQTGAFLVWGDPALYDSTLRILPALERQGFSLDYEVIPGISAVQALTAAHRTPLNAIGGTVLVTTGRRLEPDLPANAESVVVMLDGEQAFSRVDPDLEIVWGAYLGTEDEILVTGRVGDVADEIRRRREEARGRHGWIMDTYLLRRFPPAE